MNVFDAITRTKIVRKFQDKEIDEKIVGLLLYSATHALSAGNIQEWEFVVVNDSEIKKKLAKSALNLEHIVKAPIDIVVCADLERISLKFGKRGELVYSLEDAAQASLLIILAANALGLGSDLIRIFDEDGVKQAINLPDNLRPVSIIPIGYSAEEGEIVEKNPFENLTYMNEYGNKIAIEFKPLQKVLESMLKNVREDLEQKNSTKNSKNSKMRNFFKKILR